MPRNLLPTPLAALLAIAGSGFAPVAAEDECGGPDTPCNVADGTYYARHPGADGPVPSIVYLHGYGAGGARVIDSGVAEAAAERGFAVIAPDGQIDPTQGSALDWNVEDGIAFPRDDADFVAAVIADATARFGLDPGRVVVSGYSRGASMAWDLACRRPDLAQGFAAASGVFWYPLPDGCAGPVPLLHVHGLADTTMPLEGRHLDWFGTRYRVAGVMESVGLMRNAMGCALQAETTELDETGSRRIWSTSCTDGGSLTLVLTAAGHNRQPDWPALLLDWADSLP